MAQFLDMNDDCIDHVLKWFKHSDSGSIETMVAVSLTCTRLQSLTARFMEYKSYNSSITSEEDENRVKRTISTIGKSLTDLNVNIAEGYTAIEPSFLKRLSEKCPNLQKFEFASNMTPNATFAGVQILKNLEHLDVQCYQYIEDVDRCLVMQLAREAKKLDHLRVGGAEWEYRTVIDFIHAAEKLNCLHFEIEYIQKHLSYQISNCFMDEFRYLNVTDPSEMIYFLVN